MSAAVPLATEPVVARGPSPMSAEAQPTPWIASARFDLAFFSGSVLAPMLLWLAFTRGLVSGLVVLLVYQLGFNLPHQFQTWTLSLFDRDEWRARRIEYVCGLLFFTLLFAVPSVLSPTRVLQWVVAAVSYWGFIHIVRQHYGLLRLYDRKARIPPRESLVYARVLDATCYLPLIIRWRSPALMSLSSGLRLPHPVLPRAVWLPLAVAYGAIMACATIHLSLRLLRTGRQAVPRAILFASIAFSFGFAGFLIDNILVATAFITTFHNVQYMALIWYHHHNRAALGEIDGNAVVRWVRDRRLWRWAAVTVAYSLLLFAPLLVLRHPLASVPGMVGIAMHYWVDGRVWRMKDNPRRARYLGLSK